VKQITDGDSTTSPEGYSAYVSSANGSISVTVFVRLNQYLVFYFRSNFNILKFQPTKRSAGTDEVVVVSVSDPVNVVHVLLPHRLRQFYDITYTPVHTHHHHHHHHHHHFIASAA